MSAVAIVTGASSGIGEACARRLHEAGFVVHAVARRVEPMAELATMGVHTSHVDVTVDARPRGTRRRACCRAGRSTCS